MRNINDSYIALALTQDIQGLSKPLNDLLGISGFCYHKIFPDGYEICLSNSDRWVRHYHKNNFTLGVDYLNSLAPQEEDWKSFLWPFDNKAKLVAEARKVWGFSYGISISNGQNEYFGFAKEGNDINVINSYLNNLEQLERFCRFFVEKAEKTIHMASQDIILYNPNNKQERSKDTNRDLRAIFKKQTPILNYSKLSKYNKEFKLTYRELDCLKLLIHGYTAKEIALTLGISFRTVETHLENIKNKTGVASKSELIKFVFENEFGNLL